MSQSNGYRKRLISGRGFDTEREYVHQEYPKWVNGVVVQTAEEEAALAAVEPVKDDLE